MVDLKINIEWAKDTVTSWLSDKLSNLSSQMMDTVNSILEIFLGYAQDYSPVLTGELRDSIQIDMDGMGGTVMTDLERVDFILFGTEPHDIEPVNAKALYWPGADHPVKLVHHPGTTANDFFATAFMDGVSEAEQVADIFMDWLVE